MPVHYGTMRILFPVLLLLSLAVPVVAQGPAADWQTIETEHFRVHYPREYAEWAGRAAARLESIRSAVVREVGFEPPQTVDVIITNPIAQANGMALPLLDSPRMVFYAEPPGPDEQIGTYESWIDLLAVHEVAHLIHMLRPSRNPLDRLLEKSVLPLNPVSRRAPRWVLEGYATVIEGRLTGSGRPGSSLRALVLRRWAQEGRLPSYDRLDSDQRFLGMSMAYLAGSAFLEWLEERNGPESLRRLWARMTARQRRSFDDAFAGVFGEKPERMYGRFTAELAAAAMTIDGAQRLQEGVLFQRTAYASGDPAASPDGTQLAIVIRERRTPAKLVIWSTGEPEEEEKKLRERLEKILARDPDDVAPVRTVPLARKPRHTLTMTDGGDIATPRWSPDGKSLVFAHRMPDREGFLHFDLFRWFPSSGRVDRLTQLADVRDADPLPDGRRAVAVRSRGGRTQLVLVDLATGALTALTEPGIDVVYSSPRIRPDGEEVVYAAHREGGWRLELLQLSSGKITRVPTSPRLHFSAPTWLTNAALLASVASGGFVELANVSREGDVTPLTRSAGGAFGATAASDRIYFMSLEPDGFVVRSLDRSGGPAEAWPQFGRPLVPALPPQSSEGEAFVTAPLPAARSYGLGRQEVGWLLGQNLGPEQNAFEAGVRIGDVIGRLDTLLIGSFSDDQGQHGGAIATVWRGWPVELGLHLFTARERLEDDTLGERELEREGAELRAAWNWTGALRRVSLQAGGFAGDPDDLAFGEVTFGMRQLHGRARLEEEVRLWADHADATHLRAMASVRARLGSLGLGFNYQHDQLSNDSAGSSIDGWDALSVGGLPSSIVPSSLHARRVLDPALPPGTLRGERFDGWRVEASLAGPLTAFYQRHDTDVEGLGLAGAELAMRIPPLPLLKTPAFDLTTGGAKIFDGAMRGDIKYWVALTWRP